MKIVLITTTFLPIIGGVQYVVHNLAIQWHKQGHDVYVLNTVTDQIMDSQYGYYVRKYSYLPGSSFLGLGLHQFPYCHYTALKIQKLCKKINPDFISAHFGYPIGIWLSKLKHLPRYFITCHGIDLINHSWGYRKKYNIDKQMAKAFNKADGVVATSTFAREQFESIGVKQEKIFDIPNGVNYERLQKKINIDMRKKNGIPQGTILILSVGRNVIEKDYHNAVKAFSKVASNNKNVHYMIIGSGTESIVSLAKTFQCEAQITLCQNLTDDEVLTAYQQADIFLSSSKSELCPLVVLEALAAGLPEVVTNISGSQDIIKMAKNGLIVEPGNPNQMADALNILINDETMRRRMAENNRVKAKFYSWENISRMYLESNTGKSAL